MLDNLGGCGLRRPSPSAAPCFTEAPLDLAYHLQPRSESVSRSKSGTANSPAPEYASRQSGRSALAMPFAKAPSLSLSCDGGSKRASRVFSDPTALARASARARSRSIRGTSACGAGSAVSRGASESVVADRESTAGGGLAEALLRCREGADATGRSNGGAALGRVKVTDTRVNTP